MHLRCAGIRQAQYTVTWTCHLHRESSLTTHTDITPPLQTMVQAPYPLPILHHRNQNRHVSNTPPIPAGLVEPNPLSTHATPIQTHPHKPCTTLIYNMSAALDTMPEPHVPPICPAFTTTAPPHPHMVS